MLVVIAFGSDLPATWHFQALFFVVLISVCALRFEIHRAETVNLATMVGGFAIFALLASPVYALYRSMKPTPSGREFYRATAERLTKAWHETYGTPLKHVSGDDGLAFAATFYSSDHPRYSQLYVDQDIWQMPMEGTFAKGWSALCFTGEPNCDVWMTKIVRKVPSARRWTFQARLSLWGFRGATRDVTAIMIASPAGPAEEAPAQRLDEVGARRRSD
jgi:hypothetical protein